MSHRIFGLRNGKIPPLFPQGAKNVNQIVAPSQIQVNRRGREGLSLGENLSQTHLAWQPLKSLGRLGLGVCSERKCEVL